LSANNLMGRAMSYFGVDSYSCPRANVSQSLRNASARVICFYLANGGYPAGSYNKAAFQSLSSQGWGFLPTFSGYRPGDPRRGEDPSDRYVTGALTKLNGALGGAQARQATTRMADVGFPRGSVIYLDLETGDPCAGDYLDYVATWMTSVRSFGYEAAIYCPSGAVPSVSKLLPWKNKPLIWLAKPDTASNQLVIDISGSLPVYNIPAGIIAIQFATGAGGEGNEFSQHGTVIGHFDCNMSVVANPSDFSSIDALDLAPLVLQDYVIPGLLPPAPTEPEAVAISRVHQIDQSIVSDPVNVAISELHNLGITGDEESSAANLDAADFALLINDVNSAGNIVYADPTPARIASWIQLKLLLVGVESESLADVTTDIIAHYPSQTAQALNLLPSASKAAVFDRIPEFREQAEVLQFYDGPLASSLVPRAASLAVAGRLTFLGTAAVGLSSGQKMIVGQLTVPDSSGSAHAFKINTGGYGKSYRNKGGPTPPGNYTVSGPFSPDPSGMIRDGVGFKFKLQPSYVHTPGGDLRGLFCIHPDGNLPGTLGCLGIAEASVALKQCRDLIAALTAIGTVELTVNYSPGVLF
jgi:Domain of unknown function (DUF1906)